jgi:hypothetical protein
MLAGANAGQVTMPDGAFAVRQREFGFNPFKAPSFIFPLIKETQLDRIRSWGPDSEISSAGHNMAAQDMRIGWFHFAI